MKPRSHVMGLADALRAGGNERQADLERQAARTVLDGIEAAPPTDTAAHVAGRDGTDEPLPQTSASFVARATTGRWSSRGAR